MADKIDIEIALEGGTEVEKQLANIGKAGQQAFGDIQNAADQIDLSSATDALKNVQTAVQGAATLEKIVQGIGKVEGAFDALGNAASKMATRLTKSLGVLGVFARALGPVGIALGVVGGAFIKFGDDAADALNGLTVAAAKLGQTPQTLDRLQKAFTQLGVAPDAVISGLQRFRETLGADFTGNFTNQLQQFIARLEQMPDGVQRTQLAIQKLGEALGGQVIAGLQAGTLNSKNFAEALAGITPVTQQQIIEAAKYQQALNQLNTAWIALKASFAPITTPIFEFLTAHVNEFAKNIKQLRLEIAFLKGIWDVFWAGVTGQDVGAAARKAVQDYKQLETQLFRTGQAAKQGADESTVALNSTSAAAAEAIRQLAQVGAAGQEAGAQARQTEEAAASAARATSEAAILGEVGFNSLAAAIALANHNLRELATAARKIAFISQLDRPTTVPFERPRALASGGMIGGRGTGTSDSNLAWVSRGEHIMPARAVGQPGVLAFLEALRRSGGNLRGVLDGLGRFALGGLVPRPAMASAGGGAVGGMSNVTIQFPGLPPVGGLRASSAVVDELRKAAALAQVRSGGRKPSRYS